MLVCWHAEAKVSHPQQCRAAALYRQVGTERTTAQIFIAKLDEFIGLRIIREKK